MARTPKLDDVLAADVASAREALARQVPDGQIGEHLGASAEGDRLVLHRFEAKMRGYAGWHWYVTLARGPRVKVATVCDSGLLPGQDALLAPAWVPWAERVAPEELAEQKARDESEAAEAAAAAEPAGESADAAGESEAPAEEPDAAPQDAEAEAPADGVSEPEEDEGGEDGPTRPRRRRRPRRRQRSTS